MRPLKPHQLRLEDNMQMENIDHDLLKKRGFLRQRQDGFFVLRTRMATGVYKKEQLEKLADIASRYGNGIVHATTRQGLEIPFIKYEDISAVEKELRASGILLGTSGPRLRTTTACPGNNWCKRGLIDTFHLAERIEKELGMVCGMDLPHKFKISISGCPNGCMRPQNSEIGIHGTAGGFVVYLGGCNGRTLRNGLKLDKIFTEDEVLSLVQRSIAFFKSKAKPKQRLALLIEEAGKENFLKEVRG
ncbi:MAG: hypothetical protein COX96_05520 [Candidatus Omnitrophica bacterium CG_4_10_14_0_2_um_filter_44_9]|nr:MAG: hypothetical protein COY78_09045 [Candidatus Omnitrophica bacterium CG_4_10_14_0_8_um_filter_44_12]PIZ84090.1 MAG: hypothetical protein COX96_05520 [Candidatus Omnitrophica bacterium CG_4_10_14_0_2_um_filter_44_9]